MSDTTRSHDTQPDDSAPGEGKVGSDEFAAGLRSYLIGLGLAVLLTAVSFFISGTSLVWRPSIPVALFVLAIAQMGVHLVFFLHITTGSLWIMAHLNQNMMPMNRMMPMQR